MITGRVRKEIDIMVNPWRNSSTALHVPRSLSSMFQCKCGVKQCCKSSDTFLLFFTVASSVFFFLLLLLYKEYGLRLASHIFVKEISQDSLAARDGNIQEGDVVLKV